MKHLTHDSTFDLSFFLDEKGPPFGVEAFWGVLGHRHVKFSSIDEAFGWITKVAEKRSDLITIDDLPSKEDIARAYGNTADGPPSR